MQLVEKGIGFKGGQRQQNDASTVAKGMSKDKAILNGEEIRSVAAKHDQAKGISQSGN